MTKTGTNLLGIFITILAGTYFYSTYCSACADETGQASPIISIFYNNILELSGKTLTGQPGEVSSLRSLPTLMVVPPILSVCNRPVIWGSSPDNRNELENKRIKGRSLCVYFGKIQATLEN